MKFAIISDIHGNYPALQAVLSDIEAEKVDRIVCLGDLVGYYCMINEVIETIREKGIQTICGNHDYALVFNNGIIERSKTCTRILTRQQQYITPENIDYLKQLEHSISFETGHKTYYCVHGGLNDEIDEYIRNIDLDYFEANNFQKDVLMSGHTHMVRNEVYGPKRYLNPGSVGQPRDGNPAAAYLLIEDDTYRHKRVKYDIAAIAAKMREEQYDEYIYEILYRGVKIGE